MKASVMLMAALILSPILGCMPPPQSGKGFTLPAGDRERGQQTYVTLHCNACHKIDGVQQLASVEGADSQLSVALGGEVARIKTYGELVTAIINPSHRLAAGYPRDEVAVEGDSKMTNYNDVMTVTQLTDLVTFLQSKYRLKPYEPTDYPVYGPF